MIDLISEPIHTRQPFILAMPAPVVVTRNYAGIGVLNLLRYYIPDPSLLVLHYDLRHCQQCFVLNCTN